MTIGDEKGQIKEYEKSIQNMRRSGDTFRDFVPKWEKREFNVALWFLTWMTLISHILSFSIFHVQLLT